MDPATKMTLYRCLYTAFLIVLPELIQIVLMWKIYKMIKKD